MLELKDVVEVIAARDLTLDETGKVTVLIGKPQQLADIHWYGPYQKVGIGSGKVKRAEGVDLVQALVLALSMLGAELYCSQEYEVGRLSWDGGAAKGQSGGSRPTQYPGHIAAWRRRRADPEPGTRKMKWAVFFPVHALTYDNNGNVYWEFPSPW
jgi:hypothetical protein